jgi:hypothetical protein
MRCGDEGELLLCWCSRKDYAKAKRSGIHPHPTMYVACPECDQPSRRLLREQAISVASLEERIKPLREQLDYLNSRQLVKQMEGDEIRWCWVPLTSIEDVADTDRKERDE